jgi:uncharacterized protein YndB with AHSA1/START domain
VTSPPGDAVSCQVVVAARPEAVFDWFVLPGLLVRWIGSSAQLEPRPGGRFQLTGGQWCSGRYLEVVPGRRVVVSWGWESGAIPVPPGSSTVAVDLLEHPRAPGSRLATTAAWPRGAPVARREVVAVPAAPGGGGGRA